MHGHRKGLDKEVGVGKVGAHLGDLRDDVKENDDVDDIDETDDAVTMILMIIHDKRPARLRAGTRSWLEASPPLCRSSSRWGSLVLVFDQVELPRAQDGCSLARDRKVPWPRPLQVYCLRPSSYRPILWISRPAPCSPPCR